MIYRVVIKSSYGPSNFRAADTYDTSNAISILVWTSARLGHYEQKLGFHAAILTKVCKVCSRVSLSFDK